MNYTKQELEAMTEEEVAEIIQAQTLIGIDRIRKGEPIETPTKEQMMKKIEEIRKEKKKISNSQSNHY